MRRRKCCWIKTSRLGGFALAYLRWNRPIARAYWLPRKMSSSSFSRRAIWFQTGIATVQRIAMTPSATMSTAMAYPRWSIEA